MTGDTCPIISQYRGARDIGVARAAGLLLSAGSAAIALSALFASPARAQTDPGTPAAPAVAPAATPAQATPAAPAAQTASGTIGSGEIIVTAERRSESLSKVPLSISALSATTLKERVVTREQDLATVVPGHAARSDA